MPYLGTMLSRFGTSTSAGSGIDMAVAGSPISAAKRSNCAGEVSCSIRALPAGDTVKECGIPFGSSKNEPGRAVQVLSPQVRLTSPWRM